MGENSKIEWCDHTFNPWRGCSKVSAGCANCYAEVSAPSRVARGRGVETWGANASRVMASDAQWAEPLKWNRKAEAEGVRYRVFCASLADVFEDYAGGSVRDASGAQVYESLSPLRAKLFELIRQTPSLDWLLLTKRPENVDTCLRQVCEDVGGSIPFLQWVDGWRTGEKVPLNVWVGATVENQAVANERVDALLRIPAAIRFLSCEPLLGEVTLAAMEFADGSNLNALEIERDDTPQDDVTYGFRTINWVICGGESGANARPMHPGWARSLRDQCAAAGVPFLFKQWGEFLAKPSVGAKWKDGSAVSPELEPVSYERIGKKAAGRLLDGVEHNEFPEVKL